MGVSDSDILRAAVFGLGAAIVGAIVWNKITYHTGYELGLIAVGVGWAVGGAVAAGARGQRGRSLQVMGALLACFAMLLGQALILMDHARDSLGMEGLAQSSVALFIFCMLLVPRVLIDTPFTLLFIALGIWEGWRIPGAIAEEVPDETAPVEGTPAEATTSAAPGTGSAT